MGGRPAKAAAVSSGKIGKERKSARAAAESALQMCIRDRYGTAVYCKECSEKVMARRKKGSTDGQRG